MNSRTTLSLILMHRIINENSCLTKFTCWSLSPVLPQAYALHVYVCWTLISTCPHHRGFSITYLLPQLLVKSWMMTFYDEEFFWYIYFFEKPCQPFRWIFAFFLCRCWRWLQNTHARTLTLTHTHTSTERAKLRPATLACTLAKYLHENSSFFAIEFFSSSSRQRLPFWPSFHGNNPFESGSCPTDDELTISSELLLLLLVMFLPVMRLVANCRNELKQKCPGRSLAKAWRIADADGNRGWTRWGYQPAIAIDLCGGLTWFHPWSFGITCIGVVRVGFVPLGYPSMLMGFLTRMFFCDPALVILGCEFKK